MNLMEFSHPGPCPGPFGSGTLTGSKDVLRKTGSRESSSRGNGRDSGRAKAEPHLREHNRKPREVLLKREGKEQTFPSLLDAVLCARSGVGMIVHGCGVAEVIVIVRPVFARVIVAMLVNVTLMHMLMHVFVNVLMNMHMPVLVSMPAVVVGMLMTMHMIMFVSMQMRMLVFPNHAVSPFIE